MAGCAPREAARTTDEKADLVVTIRAAAASDMKFAFDEIVKAFEQDHPQMKVAPTYGSSGSFYAQLTNKAPFDIFLSADISYPHKLAEAGLADPKSEFQYAVGHLVVWVPKSSQLDVEKLGIKALADPSVRKVAIANPAHAPYGRAAEAALKSLEMYDAVKDRLVLGDNIAQTLQFVESGAADIGIVALSLALAPATREHGRYWLVPLNAYPRLEQGGVIMSWVNDRTAADALREFILGEKGRAILDRFGFELAGS
jgi:molybdate transport system substrate-binding protein